MVAKSDKIYFTKTIKPTSAYEDMLICYVHSKRYKPPTCLCHLFLPSLRRCCTKDI